MFSRNVVHGTSFNFCAKHRATTKKPTLKRSMDFRKREKTMKNHKIDEPEILSIFGHAGD
jgi:hypothetical protein